MSWAQAEGKTVYRCPGNPVLYTDTLSAKEAKDKGCRTLEGAPITIVQAVKPRPAASGATARPADAKVDPNEQRARDSDARRILEGELKREEERLAELQKEFNNGEPERHGDERNYQKYLDRVADMILFSCLFWRLADMQIRSRTERESSDREASSHQSDSSIGAQSPSAQTHHHARRR